jgi:hypothetical protein
MMMLLGQGPQMELGLRLVLGLQMELGLRMELGRLEQRRRVVHLLELLQRLTGQQMRLAATSLRMAC